MLLSFLITLDLAPAIPAHADPGDIKTSSSKTSKAPPLDDPAFTHRLGYQGQIYEDRHGVYNLTIHTSGSMVGVTQRRRRRHRQFHHQSASGDRSRLPPSQVERRHKSQRQPAPGPTGRQPHLEIAGEGGVAAAGVGPM
jgi:hypothetical protein